MVVQERRKCDVCSRPIGSHYFAFVKDGLTIIICDRSSCARRLKVQHPEFQEAS